MATTKRAVSGRPKIGSSHVGKPAARPGAAKPKPAGRAPEGAPARARAGKPRPPAQPARKPKKGAPSPASMRPPATSIAKKPAPKPRVHATEPTSGKSRRAEVRSAPSEGARQAAIAIATAALDKKAVNVQILDVLGRVDYADFLVLMSGRSDRHVVSIADGIEEALSRPADGSPKVKAVAVEGRREGNWIVLDYGDVVAHVFQEEARTFYDLDSLWQDARRVPVAPAT